MPALPKIIILLRHLPEKEFSRFRSFLDSPFFNPNNKLRRLLDARTIQAEDLERLHQQLLPEVAFHQQVFRNQLSQLGKMYRSFLAHQLLSEDEALKENFARIKAEHYGMEERSIVFRKQPHPDQVSKLSALAIGALAEHPDGIQPVPITAIHYLQQIRLRIREGRLQQSDEESLIAPNGLDRFPILVRYYHLLLKVYKSKEPEDLLHFKSTLLEAAPRLHKDHLIFFLKAMTDQCIRLIEEGKQQLYRALADIYASRIDLEEVVDKAMLRTYVKLCCRLNQPELVKNILEENKYRIQSYVYHFSYSLIAFYQRDYAQSLALLNQSFPLTEKPRFDFRQLILLNYLYLEEYDTALYQLEALRLFLIRGKGLSKPARSAAKNYVRFFRELVLIEMEKSSMGKAAYSKRKKALLSKVENSTLLTSKILLINMLKGKHPYQTLELTS